MYPAKYDNVITIGSCDKNGHKCGDSAVGKKLDFLFPGEGIRSTSSKVDRLYDEGSGTSFATPHCAATVALILASIDAWKLGELQLYGE